MAPAPRRWGAAVPAGVILVLFASRGLALYERPPDPLPLYEAASRAYVLGDSLITANRAAITIYQGAKDSVTHPGAQLKYNKGKQQLKLSREEGLYKNTPYSDWWQGVEG